ncbi:MAG: M42 family metallopeptidase [Thermoguttaceae bacterium]|nr:M42 family metallopeptidase [Thermoguttaceae bacterium]
MDQKARQFFYDLIKTPSPSGFEEKIQRVVRDYAKGFADSLSVDVHGNTVAARNPDSPFRIMIAGHCDQLGLQVNYVDDDGFVYALPLGGWDPQSLVGVRVTIWAKNGPVEGVIGRKAIHLLTEEERKRVPKVTDLWIDIGSKSKEETLSVLRVGDCCSIPLEYRELLNNRISAAATDDKSGVWVAMEALRRIDPNKLKVGVFAVSTVQEEVGLRGAKTSSYGIDPQVGIAVDVTHATDCPSVDKKISGEVKLGAGPAIGKGPNMNNKLVDALLDVADANQIRYQLCAENRITGTDAAMIQVARAGVATALVSIPNRYMHTPVEIVSWDDMSAAADLIARYCESVSPDVSYIPD